MRFVRVVLIASMYLCSANLHAQGASIHGKVLDSRTSEPIAKATVSIRDRKIETRTAATGEFELTDIEPGEMELYVTTVGYALVRKKIDISPATPVEIEILLGPEVLKRTDEITVTEKPLLWATRRLPAFNSSRLSDIRPMELSTPVSAALVAY